MPAITVFSECQKVAGMARFYGGMTCYGTGGLMLPRVMIGGKTARLN
jgi:hypothetical protein